MSSKKSILVLCPYPRNTGAGQRMKYEPYIPDWEAQGWQVDISNFMTHRMFSIAFTKGHLLEKLIWTIFGFIRRSIDLLRVNRYDIIYIYLWVTPFGGSIMERLVRRLAKAVVYDIEDNILKPATTRHPLVPAPLAPLMDRSTKAQYLAATADAVIVASPYMLDPISDFRPEGTFLIPPSIDTQRIRPLQQPRSADAIPVIGWTGTFSTKAYLDLLADPLLELRKRTPFIFRVISNFDYEMPGLDVDVVQWTAENEASDLQSLDIGVYPLVDDEWTRGKAGLKIIQYFAAGVACVGSDTPLNRRQIAHEENGLIARSAAEWVEHLHRLLSDAGLREKLARAGRLEAERLYSREAVREKYRSVLAAAVISASPDNRQGSDRA